MVGPATDSEYLLARKTAEEYCSNGYEVQLEALLDFFSNFQTDLLVREGDEVKVIEVKPRPSLAADPRISELAQLIESKPGWSFELVLVGEPERVDSPAGALPFESQGILRRLEQAEMSLKREYRRPPSCWPGRLAKPQLGRYAQVQERHRPWFQHRWIERRLGVRTHRESQGIAATPVDESSPEDTYAL